MHIAFYIAPFTGHVNTSLPLVSELVRRGHRVSYATTEGFSQAIRDVGGRVVACDVARGPGDGQATAAEPPQGGAGIDFARNLGGQLRELKAVLPVLISAFAHDPPDVVVCDPMCWAGRALAGRYRVPPINSVTTLIGKARWSLGSISGMFDPAQPGLPRLFAAVSAALAGHETGLNAAHLLGADGAIGTLVFHPRALEPEDQRFGPNIHFVGPCLPAGPGDQDHRRAIRDPWRPTGDGPVIVVSLGTVFNRQPALFRRCIDALAGERCQVVAALGGLDATSLGPLPPNAQAHDYLPLRQVLRHADVLIGHAGMRSTMEALSLGVPIAALPQMPEQHLTASRLAELGLGRCLDPVQQTQEKIHGAVTALLHDTAVRPRLTWMREEIERAPGAAGAADVVESTRLAHLPDTSLVVTAPTSP